MLNQSSRRDHTSNKRQPIRVLHVVGGMDCGGTETWLMHVLRNIDRTLFKMDFLVHSNRQCIYGSEIEALGSQLHFCPWPSNFVTYAYNFRRIIKEKGPYDVVHSHVHHFSGFIMYLARTFGARTRITHSHLDTSNLDSKTTFARQLYLRTNRRWIQQNATKKIAVSNQAADSLFGSCWNSDPDACIHYCGIDFRLFEKDVDHLRVRRELGIMPDDLVIGHIGRFVPQKNHEFLLHIHAELLKVRPNVQLLLIGQGPLEENVHKAAMTLGTAQYIRFLGLRSDIARLMRGAMDVFVMPSLYEGLGLAAVEAQAAGLPTVLSDQIPWEADVGCSLVRFVSLARSAADWAAEILYHAKTVHIPQTEALTCVRQSRFDLEQSIKYLTQVYNSTQKTYV